MEKNPTINSYVIVHRECPISYDVTSSNEVEFLFGTTQDGFNCLFDADALRKFVQCCGAALAEVDAVDKQEER